MIKGKCSDSSVWLAIANTSGLGYTLLVTPDQDTQAWRNWARRRAQRIFGEYRTEREARMRIDAWLYPESYRHDECRFA
jgi:hypothetical protein